MPDRRTDLRDEPTDRRRSPRPPLWLNVLLLVLAAATFAWAKQQRSVIQAKTAILFKPTPSNPAEINHIRDELSQLDLTRTQLGRELDARMQYLQSTRGAQFYIAVDTTRRKLDFRLGDDIVREADITIGEAKTITTPDKSKTWSFVPEKGAFTVSQALTDYRWPIPDWLYAMRDQPPPATRPSVVNGLGKYVLVLPDNYVIHTPPPPDSPLAGMAKPGSIMVPEADLAAIWPRISNQTRVYIF